MDMPEGYCFHMETMGAVDGPGLRLVLFMQGCPLRCPYCHNPEGWSVTGGLMVTIDDIMAILRRYSRYYKNGGITVSGGEPLLQAEFVSELFRHCRRENIHTALDTSGCINDTNAEVACYEADLILLDIKHTDPSSHEELFGFPLNMAKDLLDKCEHWEKPVWIRHVIAPGITDSKENIKRLAHLLKPYTCIKHVELLPFRKLCLEKYAGLSIQFPMESLPEIDTATIDALTNAFKA